MTVLWPGFLLLLGLLPVAVVGYIWMLRRRRKYAVRFSDLSLVRSAIPRHARLRRHLPFALLLAAFASLLVALARPAAIVTVPTSQTSVVLALDVSRSMLSNDIQPTRLEAAQQAALSFINRQAGSTRIGVVAFAGNAETLLLPTSEQETLQATVQSLVTGRGTAIGSGILEAIDVIAQIDPNVAPSVTEATKETAPPPVPKGVFAPDIIVVLTDGVATTGPRPLDAAKQAADRGVRVYTIGFGTEAGGDIPGLPPPGFSTAPSGSAQNPGGFRRGIDEETLRQVAELTGGAYYSAESADELQSVFQSLPVSLITKRERMEISVAFTALGALLAAAAVGLSLRWNWLA